MTDSMVSEEDLDFLFHVIRSPKSQTAVIDEVVGKMNVIQRVSIAGSSDSPTIVLSA